jgi:hypothetical protein
VTPLKLDITKVLVEYRKYERSEKWTKFFADKNEKNESDTEPEWKPEIFPREKSNLPPNTSSAVKTFLGSVKSEISGSIYNKTHSNISKAEREALSTLVKLQRNCIIVIKPCDKGAGIIICDFKKYVDSSEKELNSTTIDVNKYYKEITELNVTKSKEVIDNTLKKALDTNQISKTEYDAMIASEKTPGKFN